MPSPTTKKVLSVLGAFVPPAVAIFLAYRGWQFKQDNTTAPATPALQQQQQEPLATPPPQGNNRTPNKGLPEGKTKSASQDTPSAQPQPSEEVAATPLPFDNDQQLCQALLSHLPAGKIQQFLHTIANPTLRIVQCAEAIAVGERPTAPLDFLLRDKSPFTTATTPKGELVVSPAAAGRWQYAIDAFCAIPPKTIAALYKQALPLLQQSYNQIGGNDQPVGQLFRLAAEELLEVPTHQPALLIPGPANAAGGIYLYADPQLESLSDAQKLFLRLGESNCRRIQNHLRQIITLM